MSELNNGRAKSWSMFSSSNHILSPPPQTDDVVKDGPWKSSMSAISFGFVATAILISMFLIMAIFEHFLFRPPNETSHDDESGGMESTQMQKLGNTDMVQTSSSCISDFPVVMPGHQHPTFIAQPAPLPCPREGMSWPLSSKT